MIAHTHTLKQTNLHGTRMHIYVINFMCRVYDILLPVTIVASSPLKDLVVLHQVRIHASIIVSPEGDGLTIPNMAYDDKENWIK